MILLALLATGAACAWCLAQPTPLPGIVAGTALAVSIGYGLVIAHGAGLL